MVATLAFLTFGSCAKEVDRAAKRRIFSPEDPPKVVASAAERLSAEQLAADPRLAQRVLEMGAAEATERLGPHEYGAQVKFTWSTEGQPDVVLEESRSLKAGKGGVNGDFAAVVTNSHDQGLEVMRVAGEVFARSEYGKFRQRLRDRGMAEREREEVFGSLRDVVSLFKGRVKLVRHSSAASYEGRPVVKYAVALSPASLGEDSEAHLPDAVQPKGGVDGPTRARMHFFESRQPTSLSGELWVDQATAVVLQAKLNGALSVPRSSPKDKSAQLKLALDASIHHVGQAISFAPPKEYLRDEDKPKGIAVALERFGFFRKGAPAQSKEPESEPEN